MLIFNYSSKKELKANIGKKLNYAETSIFGVEYKSNGLLVGSNRPYSTSNTGREFFAEVVMRDDKIASVK